MLLRLLFSLAPSRAKTTNNSALRFFPFYYEKIINPLLIFNTSVSIGKQYVVWANKKYIHSRTPNYVATSCVVYLNTGFPSKIHNFPNGFHDFPMDFKIFQIGFTIFPLFLFGKPVFAAVFRFVVSNIFFSFEFLIYMRFSLPFTLH